MLITPTRSAHNPPRPAINSGIAKRSVAPEVPGDEISVAPVITSTTEIIKKMPAINRVTRAGDLKNDLAFDAGFAAEFVLVDIT
jgi:hypothetical protein